MPGEPLLATNAQRAFVSLLTFQGIVVLVMIAITFRLVDVNEVSFSGGLKTLPCYLALFAFAEIFEVYMAFDALRLRNVIQLIGILLFHLALVVMAALQVEQTHTALVTSSASDCATNFVKATCDGSGSLWAEVKPYLIVVPCVIGAAWFGMVLCFKYLYAEFGWAIFHVVGANPKMKSMYQWYQIMICLLKFDFFFFVGVTMQLLILVLSRNSAEFGVTIAAIPVVLILLFLCGLAVQREIKWIMATSEVLMLAAMTYLYKLVRFFEPSSRAEYATTRDTLTTFTVVAFLLLFLTFGVGIRCFSDFDRGLQASKVHGGSYNPINATVKLEIFGKGKESSADMEQRHSSNYVGGSQLATKISIE
ncbi:hypothetical protein FISHEDRAFT_71184 [Fistulina hepatica ATCC 64428]|nr:hypothetical protein FISHEDRAFT_71184 [Fistulina hepatica ATCC 64428]